MPSSPRPEASSRTSSRRASGGQGSGSGGHSRASRAAVGGASTTSRSAASAAARSSSAGSSAGRARRSSTTSLAARATPSASGVSDGRRAPTCAGRASASSTRRQVSRDRWVIRRPSSRTCTCAARASALPQLRGQCGAELGPQLRRDPVGGPAGEVVHEVADVEQGHPAALELDVRDVDQPGRDQRLEHGRVADPALGLLEVGHRLVRELAHQVVPRADELVQLRQPLAGVPAPLREHGGAQPKGEVGVAGQVPHVEQAGGDPQVGLGGRDHLGQRPHRVVDVRAGVPQRVPELLGDPAQLLLVDGAVGRR